MERPEATQSTDDRPAVADRVPYEPPRLTPIGNAHELLGGAAGSQIDADPPPAKAPQP